VAAEARRSRLRFTVAFGRVLADGKVFRRSALPALLGEKGKKVCGQRFWGFALREMADVR
jgi:hypothetical protein